MWHRHSIGSNVPVSDPDTLWTRVRHLISKCPGCFLQYLGLDTLDTIRTLGDTLVALGDTLGTIIRVSPKCSVRILKVSESVQHSNPQILEKHYDTPRLSVRHLTGVCPCPTLVKHQYVASGEVSMLQSVYIYI